MSNSKHLKTLMKTQNYSRTIYFFTGTNLFSIFLFCFFVKNKLLKMISTSSTTGQQKGTSFLTQKKLSGLFSQRRR